jgi:hypothetical protein
MSLRGLLAISAYEWHNKDIRPFLNHKISRASVRFLQQDRNILI